MQIVEKTKRPAWRSPVFAGWFGKAAFAGSGPRTGIPAVASQDIRPCNAYCSKTATHSCGRSFVEVQHPAEARSAIDALGVRPWNAERHDQLVLESLMIALTMVMPHVFTQRPTEHRGAERYQLR